MNWFTENWPLMAALVGFFIALGEARVRVMDLRERVKALELSQSAQSQTLFTALEELKLDVREIKTVLKLLRRDGNQ